MGTTMNDSGMSDSQFMRFQGEAQKKMKKYIDDFDNKNRIREMKTRWEAGKGKKKTFLDKIKEYLK